jgi:hypothetical protein
MTDRNGSEADHPPPATQGSSRDGLIDFTHYSAEQLRELQYTLDRTAYPLNFDNLLQELERRAKQDETLRWRVSERRRLRTSGALAGVQLWTYYLVYAGRRYALPKVEAFVRTALDLV